MKASDPTLIPAERIERRILLLRGQKVLLDFQLAELYGVATKTLNQAVKRNAERFPEDFMFQLDEEEAVLVLRSQIVTSNTANRSQSVISPTATASQSTATAGGRWSQIVTTSEKFRRATHRPYAFTEQGVAMLSSVLRSPRAVQVNIAIMRTFVQLRQMLASHADLARKLAALERKYDAQFKVVFDAIRALMEPAPKARGEVGFHTTMIPRAAAARGRRGTTHPL
ncbi:MAG TPA: ORF6N domain-containing protein [Verrucomicrobiota bacterium]|nr:ORF6N domain-containing protein [Verrucomicrobiota bacterium]